MGELFASFGLAMLTGVLCIYIVLVLLFHGFMQPLTILAALPLSLGGAFVALLVTHSAFSMPSLIGLIMLMGIATKNSILLVDYAIIARHQGMNRWDALVDACHKRARPIVMTTIAMGAGMLPIAMGWGTDPSFRAPMAIVVIGGLITSTFLSLLVIPVLFTYVDDAVRARCTRPMSHDEFYGEVAQRGFTFGPRFMGIEALTQGDGEALGRGLRVLARAKGAVDLCLGEIAHHVGELLGPHVDAEDAAARHPRASAIHEAKFAGPDDVAGCRHADERGQAARGEGLVQRVARGAQQADAVQQRHPTGVRPARARANRDGTRSSPSQVRDTLRRRTRRAA